MKNSDLTRIAEELVAPATDVKLVADHSPHRAWDEGFLQIRRVTLQNEYANGEMSREYSYDYVERNALDAVAIVLESGEGQICLRTAIRPPLLFRKQEQVPILDPEPSAIAWEVPAGLIEPAEKGESGIQQCAARETLEEVGLVVPAKRFAKLGAAVALSAGVIGEKIYFLHARVQPSDAGAPTEDGSPLEERAEVRWVSIEAALAAIERGEIVDIKTEVAIRRLADFQRSR
jgi:ADP-ribose pyrophosphatase